MVTSPVKPSFWHRLFLPHPSITEVEQRWQARLLAALCLISCGILALDAVWIGALSPRRAQSPWAFVPVLITVAVVGAAYELNRRGRYRWSARLFIMTLLTAIQVLALSTALLDTLYYDILVILLSVVLLSRRETWLVFLAAIGVELAFTVFTNRSTVILGVTPFIFLLIVTPSVLVVRWHLSALERERRAELEAAYGYNRRLIEVSLDPLMTVAHNGMITDVNAATEAVTGFSREELIGTEFANYFTEPERARAGYQEVFQQDTVRDYPLEIRHRDGPTMSVLYNASVYRDVQGQVVGVFAAARDVTQRQRTETALREANELLERIFATTEFMIAYLDTDFNFIRVNRAYAAKDDRTPEFFPEKNHFVLYPNAENEAIFRHVVETGEPYIAFAKPFVYAANPERGVTYWNWTLQPVRDAQGNISGLVFTLLDVTERERAVAAMQQSEAALRIANAYNRSLIEASLDPLVTIAPDGTITDVNAATELVTGFSRQELVGTDFTNYFTEPDRACAGYQEVFQQDTVRDYPLEIRHRDGHTTAVLYNASVYRDSQGQVIGVFAAARDVTERKRAEEAIQRLNAELEARVIRRTAQLQTANQHLEEEIAERKRVEEDLRRHQSILNEQRERYRVTLSSIGDAVIATDAQGEITFMNPVAERLTGWPQVEALGQDYQQVFRIVNENTRQVVENPVARVLHDGVVVGLTNHTILIARDGQERPIDDSGAPIYDADAQLGGVVLVFRDISAQRRAENERRAYEQQLQQVIDTVPVLIASVDTDKRFRFCNQALAASYGLTPGALRGKRIQDVADEAAYRRAERQMDTALSGRAVSFENAAPAGDGSIHTHLVSYVPEFGEHGQVNGLITAASDITALKQAEQENAGHVARLSVLADASRAFAEANRDLHQLYDTITERLATLIGEACALRTLSEDGEWMDVVSVFHPDPVTRSLMHDLAGDRRPTSVGVFGMAKETGQTIRFPVMTETQFRNSTPPHLHAHFERIGARSLIIAPLRVADHIVGFLTLTRVTPDKPYLEADEHLVQDLASRAALAIENAQLYTKAQMNAETLRQQVAERTQELQRALERARAADRAKTMMLSNVTHEMRTPLSSIVGFSHLLIKRTLSEEKQQEFTKAINQEGRRLTRLIDDFLDLQRIEAGRQTFSLDSVDLSTLVLEEIDQIELEDARLSPIRTECEPVPLITADKERLRQVIRNLFSNALKFSPEGEITLSVRATDHDVIFSIRDHGIGIPADELGQLFQRFYRGEVAEQQRIRGTGLGLALCKEIIEAHHGRIWAESPGSNQGATFRFALPILPSPRS